MKLLPERTDWFEYFDPFQNSVTIPKECLSEQELIDIFEHLHIPQNFIKDNNGIKIVNDAPHNKYVRVFNDNILETDFNILNSGETEMFFKELFNEFVMINMTLRFKSNWEECKIENN